MLLGLGAGQAMLPITTAQAERAQTGSVAKDHALLNKLNMKIDLANAKLAALKARAAIELDKSNDNANRQLDASEAWVLRARKGAFSAVSKSVHKVSDALRAVDPASDSNILKAREKFENLVNNMEERVEDSKWFNDMLNELHAVRTSLDKAPLAARQKFEKLVDGAVKNVERSKLMAKLDADLKSVREAVNEAPMKSRKKFEKLVNNLEKRVHDFGQVDIETHEGNLVRKLYDNIDAEAARLKARLDKKH